MLLAQVAIGGLIAVASQLAPVNFLSDQTTSQKTLSSFSGSSTKLSVKQRNEIKALLGKTPSVQSITCSGLRLKSANATTVRAVTNRAKATCDYAKQLNSAVQVKVGTRVTTSRSSAGKVLISLTSARVEAGAKFPEPKSFADLQNFEQIAYWAWKNSADKIQRSTSYVKNLDILIGPNSGILNKNPLEATQITSRLFAGYAQPSTMTFVSFSFIDSAWTQNKLEKLLADPDLMREIKAPNRGGDKGQTLSICPSDSGCHSSSPFTNRRGDTVVLAGFTPSRLNNEGETKGELQSHEFTHVVQQHQFLGTAREMDGLASLKMHIPWWLVEGGADFGGFASKYYTNFDQYKMARLRDVFRVPKQTPQWFENFIDPASNEVWIQLDSSGEIYNVGFMITEIFAAIKGPDSQMEIIKQIANGKTMDQAFESVFGTPWKTAVPIIAKLISEERGRLP